MHTLVLHAAALGDFVLLFPLLRALTGRVTVASHASKAHLAATLFPHVRALDIERLLRPPPPGGEGDEATHVLNFLGLDLRDRFPRAVHCNITARPPLDYPGHVTRWHHEQLAAQGFHYTLQAPPVRPPSTASRHLVIHPGSGGVAKCWPPDRFAALIARLAPQSGPCPQGPDSPPVPTRLRLTTLVGEAEVDRWPRATLDALHATPVLDLPTLHATLATATAFLGNDSGPTHLAAAMGVPTVALFGPSDPLQWSPLGARVTVLAPPSPRPMDWLDIDAVAPAVRGVLDLPS